MNLFLGDRPVFNQDLIREMCGQPTSWYVSARIFPSKTHLPRIVGDSRVMSSDQPLYRIQFINNGKNYQLYVRELNQSAMFGFIEIGDFIFYSQSAVLVDPSEEKLKTEFDGVSRSYIPLQAVIRIDIVTEKGSALISDLGDNVTAFPYSPGKKPT